MSKDQVHLRSAKKKRNEKIRWGALGEFEPGVTSLRDGLRLDDAAIGKLRDRGEALYHAGKWRECIDVIEALSVLDDFGPFDALMLSRAYDEIGDQRRAASFAKLAEEALAILNALIEERAP